ncbi:MAG: TrbI F-type domain-containing protein [Sphingomonadaceae bacterium]|nr:TrbI F-type domain-containing protein [Sphingomonadaceae bacterium]
MATDASQFDLGLNAEAPTSETVSKPAKTFAGLSLTEILVGALLLLAAIWAMWTTRELLALRQHKVVSVRLGELVNQFALAEARSGDDPDKVTARTRAFMQALDKALKERSAAGAVVLVGEAVVSSSSEDITGSIADYVAKLVPMPVAQTLLPRMPVAPMQNDPAAPSGGVAQAMLSAIGSSPQSAPFGAAGGGEQPSGYAPSSYQPGVAYPSALRGGVDGQP